MKRYYDIHTHTKNISNYECLCIGNLYKNFEEVLDGNFCSLGLHPWYLNNYESQLLEIEKYIAYNNVLAIGECGLDKVCNTDWNLQMLVFNKHIEYANKYNKPLIIHCVKAYYELMSVFNKTKPLTPVIIHGFNKNKDITKALINKNYYLSFGSALLNESYPAREALKIVPENLIFLETDGLETDIKDIYAIAAKIKNIDIDTLILQVKNNFRTIFNFI